MLQKPNGRVDFQNIFRQAQTIFVNFNVIKRLLFPIIKFSFYGFNSCQWTRFLDSTGIEHWMFWLVFHPLAPWSHIQWPITLAVSITSLTCMILPYDVYVAYSLANNAGCVCATYTIDVPFPRPLEISNRINAFGWFFSLPVTYLDLKSAALSKDDHGKLSSILPHAQCSPLYN